MKKLYWIFLLFPLLSNAQQLPERSSFYSNSFIWNPAMTGLWDYWELGLTYRQEWLGFEDAPVTATLNVQYPFPKEHMSLGGFFMHDNINPIVMNSFGFTYAYRVDLGRRRTDLLTIGLMGTLNHFFVDGKEIVVNDQDDPLVPTGENNKFGPNAGAGIFYTSYGKSEFEKDRFFAGLAITQLLPGNIRLDEFGSDASLKRNIHGNAIVGARFVNENTFIEPSLWINYSAVNLLDMNLGVRFEREDAFWAGLTYSTTQTIFLQTGLAMKNGLAKDGVLRIGALGSFNVGTFGKARGLGFEFYGAYRFGDL